MMIQKMAVAALSTSLMLGGAGTLPADQGRTAAALTPRPLQLPITGTVAGGGGEFKGTLTILRFVARDDKVVAIGMVSGSVMNAAGASLGSALVGPIELPVQLSAGGTATSTAAPGAPAPQATCGVLNIDIGPVDLDVLGLIVNTLPVGLDLTGDTVGVLGQLVCLILDTLSNVLGLVNLLNALLGLLGGVLGG